MTPEEIDHLQHKLGALEAQMKRAREVGGIGLFAIDIATQTVTATPEFFRAFGLPERAGTPAADFERLVHPADTAQTTTAQ